MKDISYQQLREGLNRRLENCLDFQGNEPNFVVAVHDYIDYINSHPVLDYLISAKLQENPKRLLKQIEKLEKESEKEVNDTFIFLDKDIKNSEKSQIKSRWGDETKFDEYEAYRKGKIKSSAGKVPSMHDCVRDILFDIYKIRGKNGFDKYITIRKTNEHIIVDETHISEKYKEYVDLKEKFSNEQSVSGWGAFDELYLCYRAIKSFVKDFGSLNESERDSMFFASMYTTLKEKGGISETNPLIRRTHKDKLKKLNLEILDHLDRAIVDDEYIPKNKGSIERIEPSSIEAIVGKRNINCCVSEKKGKGYFYFQKNKSPVEIGNITSRKYRLVAFLIEFLGKARTVETVFEAIRISRDETNSKLKENYAGIYEKRRIIKNTIKELQRIEEFKEGRLRFSWTNNGEKSVWMEVS